MDRHNVRSNDPWSSHLASELSRSGWGQTRQAVARLMLDRLGRWTTMAQIRAAGGSSGDRRLRELRFDYGWPIERQPNPEGGAWLYRLLSSDVPINYAYPPGTWGHSRYLIAQWLERRKKGVVINLWQRKQKR
jgi:hypothetical protein